MGSRLRRSAEPACMQACAGPDDRCPVRRSPRCRSAQGGFTLVEGSVVVVLIGILAAVAIPSWTRESRKTRGDSEINAMFAEIAAKEEQYKLDAGVYLAAVTCPTTPSSAGI